MAPEADVNDDEYVAKLLAKDARDSSIKYSAMGLSAYMPKRPTNAAPKPNKRFLTNLLRETDSHNAAPKKKEELEARMRLRGEPLSSSRSGQDIQHHEGRERKRRRVEESVERSRSRERKHRSTRTRHHYDDRVQNFERGRRESHRHSGTQQSDEDRYHGSRRHSHRERRTDRGRRSRSHSRGGGRSSSASNDRSARKKSIRNRRRSVSASSYSSGETDQRKSHHGSDRRSRRRKDGRPSRRLRSRSRSMSRQGRRRDHSSDHKVSTSEMRRMSDPGSDSDPLESLVGPLPPSSKDLPVNDPPPLTSRGRGAFKPSASAMDAHFSSSYDPTIDVHPETEDENEREDWDMALEALRDRELWKKKGAERLREAGFGEEEIKKWEDSGREKGIEHVKWSSRGEAREWDRGKVVETEGDKRGEVSLEAAWKRKDGGFMRSFKSALG